MPIHKLAYLVRDVSRLVFVYFSACLPSRPFLSMEVLVLMLLLAMAVVVFGLSLRPPPTSTGFSFSMFTLSSLPTPTLLVMLVLPLQLLSYCCCVPTLIRFPLLLPCSVLSRLLCQYVAVYMLIRSGFKREKKCG